MILRQIKLVLFILIITILFFGTGLPIALAGDFQQPPYTFLFGNHLDTHQETKLKKDKNNNPVNLSGFLYIIFTGGNDPESGLPIARHPRGADENEECGVDVDCIKGWSIRGLPSEAKFLYHSGVNGNDHPVWMLNRVDIPQPGSYTHFHWITQDSNDPGSGAVPDPCNVDHASQLDEIVPPATESAVDVVCPGWLLEIKALRTFAFEHGNEKVPVRPGIDNATHLNLVTNYAVVEDPEITETR